MNEHRLTEDMRIAQGKSNGLLTDEWMQVRGSGGCIFAAGDAASVQQELASVHADELFKSGDKDGSGELDVSELQELFQNFVTEYPQLGEYKKYFKKKKPGPVRCNR